MDQPVFRKTKSIKKNLILIQLARIPYEVCISHLRLGLYDFPIQSLEKRWRHVFLHQFFLDDYPLWFFIYIVIFLYAFSLFLSFDFLPLFFLCYLVFNMACTTSNLRIQNKENKRKQKKNNSKKERKKKKKEKKLRKTKN